VVTQAEIDWEVNWAIERLSKGQPVSESIMEAHGQAGREALTIVRQWEATEEGRRVVSAGEDIGVSRAVSRIAQEKGFTSDTEYLKSKAETTTTQTPTYNPLTQTYTSAEGQQMSMRQQEVPLGTRTITATETQPYITQEVTGSFTRDGKEIPTTKTYYVDPQTGEKRLATSKEREFLRSQTREVVASEGKPPSRVVSAFQEKKAKILSKPQPKMVYDIATSKELVTIGVPFIPSLQISAKDIKTKFETEPAGRIFLSPITSAFIPTTPLDVAIVSSIPVYKSVTAAKTTGVLFKGIQQEKLILGGKQAIKTDVLFVTSRGEKGVARGISLIKPKGDIILSKTLTIGGTLKTGLQLPTAKIVTKPFTIIGAKSIGISREVTGEIMQSFTMGKAIIKTPLNIHKDIFISRAYDIKGKTMTLTLGEGLSKKTYGSVFAGLTRQLDKTKDVSYISTGTKLKKRKIISQPALIDVKAALTGGIKKADVKSLQFTTTSLTAGVQTLKPISAKLMLPQQQKSPLKLETKTYLGSGLKQPTRQISGLKTKQLTAQRTRQVQRLAQPLALASSQVIGQRTRAAQKQITLFKTPAKARPTPIISIPTISTVPFFTFKTKPRTTRTISRATYGVGISKGKRFVPIGSGLSLGRAITMGATRTRRTPSTKFKLIPQTAGLTFEGIRTPKGFKRKKKLVFIQK